MKAEYWDVVPRRNWETLEQTHRQALQQVAHANTCTVHPVHMCMYTFTELMTSNQSPPRSYFCIFCGVQLKTLQGDFDQMKSEYDTLLELHKRGSMQNETHDPITVQVLNNTHGIKSRTQY